MDPRLAEVHRLLERYAIEVVEAFELCPWARAARLGGELAIDVLWGAPADAAWLAAGERLLARPEVRVAMVVAPELACTPAELRALRDRVAARLPHAGVADFHPDAPLDLGSPARLVPYLRRAPDPLLQLVPLALLDAVRARPLPDRGHQAQILAGHAAPPRDGAAARIAADNFARASADRAALAAVLADIAADRVRSYARVGISSFPGRR
ncbi:MAG TPA: hypothetical protein VLX92_22255 [Kofleriaceae bacterium]|nr:hypothetical protein [Kofleriaceae bacterium]